MMDKKEWNRIRGAIEEGHWTPDLDFEATLMDDIHRLWDDVEELQAQLSWADDDIKNLENKLIDVRNGDGF